MVDRFPKIEDLELGDHSSIGQEISDDGKTFLDRERAALGEDADQFASEQDHNTAANASRIDDSDLLGDTQDDFDANDASRSGRPSDQEQVDFERSFPAVDTQNEAIAPGDRVTDTLSQGASGYTGYAAPSNQEEEEETEPVRQWREKRDADLVRRDAISDQKKSETISKARSDIDDFYESYNRRTDKQKAETARQAEEFLQNREDTTAGGGGTSWERIAKLVDLSGKGQQGGGQGSTKNKMREILLELKADKNAPGVTGV